MALQLPSCTLSPSYCRINLSNDRFVPIKNRTPYHVPCLVSQICPGLMMTRSSKHHKTKMQLNIVKEKLVEALPDPIVNFPWKKAENILLQRLINIGQAVLKWVLIPLFITSSLSDVIFSISKNKELLVPVGLLVGCMIGDFLKETCEELFNKSVEEETSQLLLGISCFFVVVKFVSAIFSLTGKVFLLHVANGGLMQVLWLWKRSKENTGDSNNSLATEDSVTECATE